jgi:tRNA(Ile)-lysidine synthase
MLRGTRHSSSRRAASQGPTSQPLASLRLRALHVDHGLRPASKQWAAQCRALARDLHVPLKILTAKVARAPGTSLEAAARDARYRLLASALHPGEILLTAHHSDDQLETVLLQLLRGSGLPGISAMPALAHFADGQLARPLLSRSRAELETWVREQGLTWVEDDTNVDEGFDRNYLRLRVLPLIRARWAGSATAVARSARHAAEAQALLDTLARADVDRASYGESLSIQALRALAPDRCRNALRFWITRAGYLAPDTKRLEEIAGPLLNARPDANPFVEWGEGEGSGRAQRHGDLLSLGQRSRAPAAVSDHIWSWHDSLVYDLPHDLGKLELQPDARGPLDLDALPHPLIIRWRRGGERLSPRRGGPRRQLKNLLQEAHVPLSDRPRLPLLFSPAPAAPAASSSSAPSEAASSEATTSAPASSEERLVAVADLLLDETVQATPASHRRARLRWKKSSH